MAVTNVALFKVIVEGEKSGTFWQATVTTFPDHTTLCPTCTFESYDSTCSVIDVDCETEADNKRFTIVLGIIVREVVGTIDGIVLGNSIDCVSKGVELGILVGFLVGTSVGAVFCFAVVCNTGELSVGEVVGKRGYKFVSSVGGNTLGVSVGNTDGKVLSMTGVGLIEGTTVRVGNGISDGNELGIDDGVTSGNGDVGNMAGESVVIEGVLLGNDVLVINVW